MTADDSTVAVVAVAVMVYVVVVVVVEQQLPPDSMAVALVYSNNDIFLTVTTVQVRVEILTDDCQHSYDSW